MEQFSQEEIQNANWLFSGDCEFKIGATKANDIPDTNLSEIAFCGLSNVGKSSLINALTNRKTLARTSNTPGRTKQINFFSLRDKLALVDLPGYGYAKASKKDIKSWNNLIYSYLKGRPNLIRVFLLVDSRRGLKDSDQEIMTSLDDAAVNYQIVLTKTDKSKKSELEDIHNSILSLGHKHTAMHPEIINTSSRDKNGIEYARCILAQLAGK